jgi:hypothetical protein
MRQRPTLHSARTLAALFLAAFRDHFGLTPREQTAALAVAGLLLLGMLARCGLLRGEAIR